MRLIPINSLKVDTMLARTIYDDDGRVLLKSGARLSDSIITKLKMNGVFAVHIFDDYSNDEIKDIISPELRNLATNRVRSVYNEIQNVMNANIRKLKDDPKSFTKRLALIVDSRHVGELDKIVENMMYEITSNLNLMVGLVDIKSTSSIIYQHSIQVCVLAMLVGASLKMDKRTLKELAISAMLHDVGISFLDKNIMIYSEEFSDEDKKEYYKHCEYGHDFLKTNTMMSVSSRMGVLQHHEQINGQGYPLQLKGDQIHLFARIIAICNTYDRMTSGEADAFVPPNEALEYIMGNTGKDQMFDHELATVFARRIIAFPVGSYVFLSTGEYAVVINNNAEYPLRPKLKIIEVNKNYDGLKVVDLLEKKYHNITIVTMVYELPADLI